MPNVIYTATLDFTDNGVFNAGWRIKQGDFGSSSLNITLADNGAVVFDDSIEPEIVFKRADGRSVVSTMQSAGENSGYYIYNFVGNELAVPGPCVVDVKIFGSDSRTSTASCIFDVVPDTIGYDPTGAGTYNNPVSALAETALSTAQQAEAWAVGTKNGLPVSSGDPTYRNNSKYWSELRMGSKIKNTTGRFYTTTGGLMDSCVIGFEPKQSGSGTPSPSNVRAISGHTQVQVGNCGKNWLRLTLDALKSYNTDGTWNGNVYVFNGVTATILTDSLENVIGILINGTASSNYTLYLNSVATSNAPSPFILNGCVSGGSNGTYCLIIQLSSSPWTWITSDAGGGATGTLDEDKGYQCIFRMYAGVSLNNKIIKPMIRKATETDATFEPFNGYTHTINLGGTYYGGTLDAVSGKLTVTHGFAKVSDLTWTTQSSDYAKFVAIINNLKYGNELETVKSDIYKSYSNSNKPKFVNGCYASSGGGNTTIKVYDEDYPNTSDLNSWKTARANNVFCYELATPTTIQLTPTQLEALVGQNNLSAPLEDQSFTSAEYRDNMSAVYITDERVVGKWIDGKDIYQRTIDLGSSGVSVPANSSASTGLAKGNVQLPVWSTAISPSGQAFPHIGCSVGSTYIMMENKTNNATSVRYFTFQYTKS